MSDLTHQVVQNTKRLKEEMSQRKHSVIRVCGEEHSGSGTGSASIWLTLDNDMAYIAEMKFKLVFDTGVWNTDDPTGSGQRESKWGRDLYPTIEDFLDAYPLGTYIVYPNGYGAQCYNYALAFWNGQCNRALSTADETGYSSGYACDLWQVPQARAANAGTEFDLITKWEDVQRGDWLIWCNSTIGHVAMARSAPTGDEIMCYGQNQGNGEPRIPVGQGFAINVATLKRQGFQGAFRYKKWH